MPACSICCKSRKAHYDNLYCYAANRLIGDIVGIAVYGKHGHTLRFVD